VIIVKCNDIQALFSEYYDSLHGEDALEDAACAEVAAHLHKCALCVAEFEKYSRFLEEVRNLPDVDTPMDFHENLMEYVETHIHNDVYKIPPRPAKPKQPTFRRFAPWVAAAVSLIAVLIWMVGYFSPQRTFEQTTHHQPIISFGGVPIFPATEDVEEIEFYKWGMEGRAGRAVGDFYTFEDGNEVSHFYGVATGSLIIEKFQTGRGNTIVAIMAVVVLVFTGGGIFAVYKLRKRE